MRPFGKKGKLITNLGLRGACERRDSQGVIQTMKMVADDVRKEVLEASSDEDEATADYNKVKAKLEAEKDEIEADRAEFQTASSDAKGKLKEAKPKPNQ